MDIQYVIIEFGMPTVVQIFFTYGDVSLGRKLAMLILVLFFFFWLSCNIYKLD